MVSFVNKIGGNNPTKPHYLKPHFDFLGSNGVDTSGRPGSKFCPGRYRAGITSIPARTGTGMKMKTRPVPGSASYRPVPGFFKYFSVSPLE